MRPVAGFVMWTALLGPLGAPAAPLGAQIPDTFENLQLLDEEIPKEELVGVMRSWTLQLGVRCNHCHVGPDDLQGMDFASDEKPTKRTARRMVEMMRYINGAGLAELPVAESEGREPPRRVQCYTCHRGMSRPPRATSDVVAEALAEGGVPAAIQRFESLRSEHADAGRYDLRRTPLFHLGRSLLNQGRVEEGRELIVATLELFPDFADGHVLLGQAHAMSGDLDAAEAAIEEARRIEPENRFSRWLEGQIQARRAAQEAAAGADEKAPDLHDPAWSPTGDRIAFYSNRDGDFDLYLLDLGTGAVTQLTDDPGNDGSPAWLPDGRSLSFSSRRDGGDDAEIYRLDLESGEVTRLTDNDHGEQAQSWSPSGEWMAVERRVAGNADIYLVSADGGRERRLTEHEANDFRPTWCDGGERVVFQSKREGVYHLYSVSSAGGEVVRLTAGDLHHTTPECGSRTGRIVHVRHDAGKATIWVMDAEGSGERALTADSGGSDLKPSWSPEETRIVFYSDRDGAPALYVMSADGSAQERIDLDWE